MPDLCSQDPTFSKVIHFMDGCTALYKGHASSVDGSFAAANRDFISFEADKEKAYDVAICNPADVQTLWLRSLERLSKRSWI